MSDHEITNEAELLAILRKNPDIRFLEMTDEEGWVLIEDPPPPPTLILARVSEELAWRLARRADAQIEGKDPDSPLAPAVLCSRFGLREVWAMPEEEPDD